MPLYLLFTKYLRIIFKIKFFFQGYVYDPITKFCHFQFIPIPATDVYCDLNVGYSPCGYNAECVYDSGNFNQSFHDLIVIGDHSRSFADHE